MENKETRIRELVSVLNDSARLYYQKDGESELLSDKKYDTLYDELSALENETGIVLDDSPTRRVGAEVVSSLAKVIHKIPMMSLDKTKDADAIQKFASERAVLVSFKLDGLAVELTYKNHVLVQAATRGNGQVGENITHNARNFVNIPKEIPTDGEVSIRGEAVISFENFERINASLDEKYKNPRNLCAGTVRQLDNSATKERPVHFLALCTGDTTVFPHFNKKSEILASIRHMGFDVVPAETVSGTDIPYVIEKFKSQIADYPFATDGLVVTFDDIEYSRSLGQTSKFPKDSLAFKWADEEAETRLVHVEWSTSRTGLINPVAVFTPVEIEGTTVERASLHNVSIFEELELHEGDRLLVYKANMIIPQISANLSKGNDYRGHIIRIPAVCPSCGGETDIVTNIDTKTLCCVNTSCPAKALYSIAHFASRNAMNIEGLSEQTIARLLGLGYITSYADLYMLHEHKDELVKLKGFGVQSVAKLLAAIDASRQCRLQNFIFALGIKNIGREYAKVLCDNYDNDLSKIMTAEAEEMEMLSGFGQIMAESVYEYFRERKNAENVAKTAAFLIFEQPDDTSSTPRKLSGKIFVITGDVAKYNNRAALREHIEKEGGRVASAVSAKTDYLINNNKASSSSKNKKAAELGVAIITEDEFIKIVGD